MHPEGYSFAIIYLPACAVWCIIAGAYCVARRSWVDLLALGLIVQLPAGGLWIFNRQAGAILSWAVNGFFLFFFVAGIVTNMIAEVRRRRRPGA